MRGGVPEPVAQFDGHEGVEAEVAERGALRHRVRRGVAEHGRGFLPHQGQAVARRHGRCGRRGFGPGLGVPLRPGRGGRAGGGFVQPVTFPLERVGGQGDAPGGAPFGERERGPVDAVAARVQSGGCGGGRPRLGLVGTEQGHEQRRGIVREAAAAHGGQHGPGAQFEERARARAVGVPQAVGEPDGPPGLRHPVGRGADLLRVGGTAGHVGHDRQPGGVEAQAGHDLAELVEHAVQVVGVEGVGRRQLLDPAAAFPPVRGDVGDGPGVARDDDGIRSVDGGEGHAFLVAGERGAYLVLRRLHGDHAAVVAPRLHEAATRGDEDGRVGQRQDTGGVGGADLADRVADERVRAQAPGGDQVEQARFEGEQRGLGVGGALEEVGAFGDDPLDGLVQVAVDLGARRVVGGAECRGRLAQCQAHAGALAALPGEQQPKAAGARAVGGVRDQTRGRPVPGERRERGGGLLPVGGDERGAVRQVRAGGGQCVGDVGRRLRGRRVEVAGQAVRLRPQRRRGGRGQQPRQGARPFLRGGLRLPGVLGLGLGVPRAHDHMAVGAAHAERADAGHGRPPGTAQRGERGLHAEAEVVERDVRVRVLEVEAGREFAVAQRQQRLEQPRDTGRAFQVPDVGLHRPDGQERFLLPRGAEDRAERRGLDGIARAGAGAVQFDERHVGRVHPGPPVGQRDAVLLGALPRHGEPRAAAVVVHGAAVDDSVHGVAVGQGRGQRLEDDQTGALAADVAVGALVEGVALPVGREGAEGADAQGAFLGEVEVHAAREGDGGLPGAQALARLVDRDEGRGLAGVDGHAGAAQPQGVGEPVGDHAALEAGHRVVGDRVRAAPVEEGRVVVRGGADEDTGLAAVRGEHGRGEPRVLQGLPAEFEHQPLLRVEHRRLARRDTEERGVETVGGRQVAAGAEPRSVGRGFGDGAAAPAQ
ncbi:hypothetical protein STBA_63350 [Streptomyces sp. MP131-18]|nr:hypothetical protein STBA_63350 [Streptomyces sp. MP131-18]